MIPKVIHYCWFGRGKYPDIVRKCLESWKKYCPDYEIKLWNEDNYDVQKVEYIREAYELKKWAFVSDYARLDIIYHEGGFYLDTDVELVRSLDGLRDYPCFVAADGSGINTGLGFGAEKGHPVVKAILDLYQEKHFKTSNGPDLTPCTEVNSKLFLENGYDITTEAVADILGVRILPPEYFSPIRGAESELCVTSKTYGIHWGSRLWETGLTRIKAGIRMKLGPDLTNKLKHLGGYFGIGIKRRKG